MNLASFELHDKTVVAFSQDTAELPYYISVNGRTVCRYETFDFAWDDLGKAMRCRFQSEVLAFL